MEELKRYCKACDEEIRGRRDKQFCSDYCRAAHYNHRHADITQMMRSIHCTLRRNRTILLQLSRGINQKVHRLTLLRKGLHFGFVTQVVSTHEGHTLCFCYDQGYKDLGNGYYELFQKSEYEMMRSVEADQDKSSDWGSGRFISEEAC